MTSFAGASLLPDLKKTLLFKNRDLVTATHTDTISYDMDCFGVRGLIGGLSIGVNRHGLAVANTLVKETEDTSPHILTEQLLMFSKSAEDAMTMTVNQLRKGSRYQWSNLILADNDSLMVIELAGDDHSIERSTRGVIRTGHHIMLDTEQTVRPENEAGYDSSVRRVERGYELVRRVSQVKDVFDLLKDHGERSGSASICRHGEEGEEATEVSYVIEVDHESDTGRPRMMIHVARGYPCQATYTSIPLIFPADEEIIKRANQLYFGK
ncbi:MAG: carcinine hydrolase/isopenicillin-N N-acyltransferase family protein [Candidatus Thorarchaeota archaeon]